MPLDDIRAGRIEKLEHLRRAGIDPYPAKSWRTHRIAQVQEQFDQLVGEKRHVVLAGRMMARREHGGATFIDINDGSGTIQALIKKDIISEIQYRFFGETVDIGDFIEGAGTLFITKKNERTLEVEKFRILAKSLLPLPEKWHGLQDVEERFRKRYLDILLNEDVRRAFQMRTRVVRALREFLNGEEFMEVVTPTLQPIYGGASARPFKTHLHALDMGLFLRIAPELYLKRLLVGGFERVFEFTTNFRNEGMDRDHNPEFSALEFYAAYHDLEWAMGLTERMLSHVVAQATGTTEVVYGEEKINFSGAYARQTFSELFSKYLGMNYEYVQEDELRAKAKTLGINVDAAVTRGALADELFKKAVRPALIQPTFVTTWPAELLPLAKRSENADYVDAFQFYAGGVELIKAFTELNDPLDQRERLTAQEANRAKGDEEAQRMDNDFIEALEYGMPPAAGWGLGLDRFVAVLTNSKSLREVILFPLMRPKESEK